MAEDKYVSRFLIIGLAIVILLILILHYNSKNKKHHATTRPYQEHESYTEPLTGAPVNENLTSLMPLKLKKEDQVENEEIEQRLKQHESQHHVMPSESSSNEDYKAIDFSTENNVPNECFPRDRLTAEDLLPKDAANSKWAQVNPAGQGDVKDQNFLTAGMHIGINTVGQTNRNPNYQLRSEPPNPRFKVGPWNLTTIEYDQSRRHFEIGEC